MPSVKIQTTADAEIDVGKNRPQLGNYLRYFPRSILVTYLPINRSVIGSISAIYQLILYTQMFLILAKCLMHKNENTFFLSVTLYDIFSF